MQPGFKLIHLLLIVGWWIQPCIAAKLSGTIRTNEGTPLANVAIYVGRDVPETKTSTDGSFEIDTATKTPVIFIARTGFRPAARVIHSVSEGADIVLEPESLSTWWLTTCLSDHPAGKVIEPLSGGPRIIAPKGAKYRTGTTDIDYRVDTIAFGIWWHPRELEFWIGPAAGGPRPPSYLFEQSKDFTLRYWRSKDTSQEGIDARGSDSKGRRWRHMNIGSTSIMYRQASDAAAKFFDGLIDSMRMPTAAKAQTSASRLTTRFSGGRVRIPYPSLSISRGRH